MKKNSLELFMIIVVCLLLVAVARQARRAATAEWRLQHMRLWHTVLDVRAGDASTRITDISIELPFVEDNPFQNRYLINISTNSDNTLSMLAVGIGQPARLRIFSRQHGHAELATEWNTTNLVNLAKE